MFDPTATMRKRCVDICSLTEPSFCLADEECVHTADGVACIDPGIDTFSKYFFIKLNYDLNVELFKLSG